MVGFQHSWLNQFVPHKELANVLINALKHSWKIMNLLMGKAISLHRIIGSTGTRLEKEWRKEFDIDIDSINKIKKEIKNMSSPSVIRTRRAKRKFDEDTFKMAQRKKRKKKKLCENIQNIAVKMILCPGVTCDSRNLSLYPNSQFSPNHIKPSLKQCQRRSRFMTAPRKVHSTIHHAIEQNTKNKICALYNFFKHNPIITSHKYSTRKKSSMHACHQTIISIAQPILEPSPMIRLNCLSGKVVH